MQDARRRLWQPLPSFPDRTSLNAWLEERCLEQWGEIQHGNLPGAGHVLTAQERVVDRYSKPGKRGGTMQFATVVTEYRDAGGALVAEARATFIEPAANQ